MLHKLRQWLRRRKFQQGATLSLFIARDVRRDILVVSAERLADGIITGRVRTTNVLYLSRRLVPPPEFEPPRELQIEHLWDWTGQSWGGLPDPVSLSCLWARRSLRSSSPGGSALIPPPVGRLQFRRSGGPL